MRLRCGANKAKIAVGMIDDPSNISNDQHTPHVQRQREIVVLHRQRFQ
jgi:hypothetical protein